MEAFECQLLFILVLQLSSKPTVCEHTLCQFLLKYCLVPLFLFRGLLKQMFL